MDITQLRASHPGLYDQIFEAGAEAERDRVETHLRLASAAGSERLAFYPIIQGQDVASTLPLYRRHASNSDATAAAFVRECDKQRIAAPASLKDPEGAAADALLAKINRTRGVGATGPKDSGDLVCEAMGLPPVGSSRHSTSTHRDAQVDTHLSRDNLDKVADAMGLPPPKAKARSAERAPGDRVAQSYERMNPTRTMGGAR
jgi:hypothetical protein